MTTTAPSTATATPPVVQLMLEYPPAILNPNRHVKHWAEKSGPAAAYKQQCRIAALNVRRALERQGMTFPLAPVVTALVTFVLPNKQGRDLDNCIASFKAGLDGIVAAGLLKDDNVFQLRIGFEAELGTKAGVRVRLQGGGA